MALNNTTERFNYIYGNNAKKVERYAYYNEGTSPRKPDPRPRRQKKQKKYVKTHEAFDWRYTVMIIAAVFVILVASLFYVREISRMNRMSHSIKVMKQEKSDLLSRQTSIKLELSRSVNLDEIREYAEENLNMVCPEHDHVIYYHQEAGDYFRQHESLGK